jgi:hypothetical protein
MKEGFARVWTKLDKLVWREQKGVEQRCSENKVGGVAVRGSHRGSTTTCLTPGTADVFHSQSLIYKSSARNSAKNSSIKYQNRPGLYHGDFGLLLT